MITILPSLASADQLNLAKEMDKVQCFGHMHFDVEDGNFVPNITFGMKTIRNACSRLPGVLKDAHLMVTNPYDYIEPLSEAGIDAVCFHWEAAPYPMRLIRKIQACGMDVGIALNPRTSVCEIDSYLSEIDYVLLMSSEPDGAGELFEELTYDKIRYLRKKQVPCKIVVDGGINLENVFDVVREGATSVVMGRALFQAEDPQKILAIVRKGGS